MSNVWLCEWEKMNLHLSMYSYFWEMVNIASKMNMNNLFNSKLLNNGIIKNHQYSIFGLSKI